MTRDEFFKNFEKKSTINNYIKSFKKFDSYLQTKNQTEEEYFKLLNESEIHLRYNLLQELLNHIKLTVSPAVTRNYFENLFKYFLLSGVQLDYTQRKLRVKFPRVITRILEGLDKEGMKKLISFASYNFATYLESLAGSGMRESEGLQLEPSMIMFDEFPCRLKLPGRITKFSIPRETFLPPKTIEKIKELIRIKETKPNETIFVSNYNIDNTLNDFETVFAQLRTKAGLDTPNRSKFQQNDITLHSCRAYFITTFTDHKLAEFGHALAGHTKFSGVYFRKSLKENQMTYASIMSDLEF